MSDIPPPKLNDTKAPPEPGDFGSSPRTAVPPPASDAPSTNSQKQQQQQQEQKQQYKYLILNPQTFDYVAADYQIYQDFLRFLKQYSKTYQQQPAQPYNVCYRKTVLELFQERSGIRGYLVALDDGSLHELSSSEAAASPQCERIFIQWSQDDASSSWTNQQQHNSPEQVTNNSDPTSQNTSTGEGLSVAYSVDDSLDKPAPSLTTTGKSDASIHQDEEEHKPTSKGDESLSPTRRRKLPLASKSQGTAPMVINSNDSSLEPTSSSVRKVESLHSSPRQGTTTRGVYLILNPYKTRYCAIRNKCFQDFLRFAKPYFQTYHMIPQSEKTTFRMTVLELFQAEHSDIDGFWIASENGSYILKLNLNEAAASPQCASLFESRSQQNQKASAKTNREQQEPPESSTNANDQASQSATGTSLSYHNGARDKSLSGEEDGGPTTVAGNSANTDSAQGTGGVPTNRDDCRASSSASTKEARAGSKERQQAVAPAPNREQRLLLASKIDNGEVATEAARTKVAVPTSSLDKNHTTVNSQKFSADHPAPAATKIKRSALTNRSAVTTIHQGESGAPNRSSTLAEDNNTPVSDLLVTPGGDVYEKKATNNKQHRPSGTAATNHHDVCGKREASTATLTNKPADTIVAKSPKDTDPFLLHHNSSLSGPKNESPYSSSPVRKIIDFNQVLRDMVLANNNKNQASVDITKANHSPSVNAPAPTQLSSPKQTTDSTTTESETTTTPERLSPKTLDPPTSIVTTDRHAKRHPHSTDHPEPTVVKPAVSPATNSVLECSAPSAHSRLQTIQPDKRDLMANDMESQTEADASVHDKKDTKEDKTAGGKTFPPDGPSITNDESTISNTGAKGKSPVADRKRPVEFGMNAVSQCVTPIEKESNGGSSACSNDTTSNKSTESIKVNNTTITGQWAGATTRVGIASKSLVAPLNTKVSSKSTTLDPSTKSSLVDHTPLALVTKNSADVDANKKADVDTTTNDSLAAYVRKLDTTDLFQKNAHGGGSASEQSPQLKDGKGHKEAENKNDPDEVPHSPEQVAQSKESQSSSPRGEQDAEELEKVGPNIAAQSNVPDVIADEESLPTGMRKVPCRARKMPHEHSSNGYLLICKDTKHGDRLTCSYATCRSMFRYCKVCKQPVAASNFKALHSHMEDRVTNVGPKDRVIRGDTSSKGHQYFKSWIEPHVEAFEKNSLSCNRSLVQKLYEEYEGKFLQAIPGENGMFQILPAALAKLVIYTTLRDWAKAMKNTIRSDDATTQSSDQQDAPPHNKTSNHIFVEKRHISEQATATELDGTKSDNDEDSLNGSVSTTSRGPDTTTNEKCTSVTHSSDQQDAPTHNKKSSHVVVENLCVSSQRNDSLHSQNASSTLVEATEDQSVKQNTEYIESQSNGLKVSKAVHESRIPSAATILCDKAQEKNQEKSLDNAVAKISVVHGHSILEINRVVDDRRDPKNRESVSCIQENANPTQLPEVDEAARKIGEQGTNTEKDVTKHDNATVSSSTTTSNRSGLTLDQFYAGGDLDDFDFEQLFEKLDGVKGITKHTTHSTLRTCKKKKRSRHDEDQPDSQSQDELRNGKRKVSSNLSILPGQEPLTSAEDEQEKNLIDTPIINLEAVSKESSIKSKRFADSHTKRRKHDEGMLEADIDSSDPANATRTAPEQEEAKGRPVINFAATAGEQMHHNAQPSIEKPRELSKSNDTSSENGAQVDVDTFGDYISTPSLKDYVCGEHPMSETSKTQNSYLRSWAEDRYDEFCAAEDETQCLRNFCQEFDGRLLERSGEKYNVLNSPEKLFKILQRYMSRWRFKKSTKASKTQSKASMPRKNPLQRHHEPAKESSASIQLHEDDILCGDVARGGRAKLRTGNQRYQSVIDSNLIAFKRAVSKTTFVESLYNNSDFGRFVIGMLNHSTKEIYYSIASKDFCISKITRDLHTALQQAPARRSPSDDTSYFPPSKRAHSPTTTDNTVIHSLQDFHVIFGQRSKSSHDGNLLLNEEINKHLQAFVNSDNRLGFAKNLLKQRLSRFTFVKPAKSGSSQGTKYKILRDEAYIVDGIQTRLLYRSRKAAISRQTNVPSKEAGEECLDNSPELDACHPNSLHRGNPLKKRSMNVLAGVQETKRQRRGAYESLNMNPRNQRYQSSPPQATSCTHPQDAIQTQRVSTFNVGDRVGVPGPGGSIFYAANIKDIMASTERVLHFLQYEDDGEKRWEDLTVQCARAMPKYQYPLSRECAEKMTQAVRIVADDFSSGNLSDDIPQPSKCFSADASIIVSTNGSKSLESAAKVHKQGTMSSPKENGLHTIRDLFARLGSAKTVDEAKETFRSIWQHRESSTESGKQLERTVLVKEGTIIWNLSRCIRIHGTMDADISLDILAELLHIHRLQIDGYSDMCMGLMNGLSLVVQVMLHHPDHCLLQAHGIKWIIKMLKAPSTTSESAKNCVPVVIAAMQKFDTDEVIQALASRLLKLLSRRFFNDVAEPIRTARGMSTLMRVTETFPNSTAAKDAQVTLNALQSAKKNAPHSTS